MLTITYMAKLKEQLATTEESIAWDGGNVDALISLLRSRNGVWRDALSPEKIYKVAINHTIVHDNAYIPADAHVALLPPVTGG